MWFNAFGGKISEIPSRYVKINKYQKWPSRKFVSFPFNMLNLSIAMLNYQMVSSLSGCFWVTFPPCDFRRTTWHLALLTSTHRSSVAASVGPGEWRFRALLRVGTLIFAPPSDKRWQNNYGSDPPCFYGKTHELSTGPCSIVMWVYQRVIVRKNEHWSTRRVWNT